MNIGEKTEIWTGELRQESHANDGVKMKLKWKMLEFIENVN